MPIPIRRYAHNRQAMEMEDELFRQQTARPDAAYPVENVNMKEPVADIAPT